MANIYSLPGLQAAAKYFDDALIKYGNGRRDACDQSAQASGRDRIVYVGQFVDREAINSTQHGVYGMSAWLTLTQSIVPDTNALRASCRDALKAWIEESARDDVRDRPGGEPYELRFVIPKICHAYSAMNAVGCEDTGRILLRYIQEACKDGSWGHLTSSDQGDPCITALVVRTFRRDPKFSSSMLPQSLEFLWRNPVFSAL